MARIVARKAIRDLIERPASSTTASGKPTRQREPIVPARSQQSQSNPPNSARRDAPRDRRRRLPGAADEPRRARPRPPERTTEPGPPLRDRRERLAARGSDPRRPHAGRSVGATPAGARRILGTARSDYVRLPPP